MKRILIVDDEESIRFLYKEELEEDGFEGELAENGKEALEKLPLFKPDLITLDIKMPVKGGVEVLEAIKDRKEKPDIIVITGWDSEQVYKQCKERGVSEYINKPISLELLERSVKKLLKNRNQLF